nr:uncharacterized protein LOC115264358 [Aedes albopictus]XP_029723887.1 uncharacterized protein LOC109403988 [Aedes albopictus]
MFVYFLSPSEDREITFIVGKLGNMQLIIDGHLFQRSQVRERIVIWNCSRRRFGCKSRISTLRGKPGVAHSFRDEHNHERKDNLKGKNIKIIRKQTLKILR